MNYEITINDTEVVNVEAPDEGAVREHCNKKYGPDAYINVALVTGLVDGYGHPDTDHVFFGRLVDWPE